MSDAVTPVAAVDPADLEDIRLAVVMNGGVSLAVWIAGVTNEINRLAQSDPLSPNGVYGDLLGIVQGTARVDVVSGTSAGGINGAFLALAYVYGRDLSILGHLWASDGSLQRLLRNPLRKDAPSLLKGDEYFLDRLSAAFAAVYPSEDPGAYSLPGVRPIDLTMTVSLIDGEPVSFIDDHGTPIVEMNHRGRLHFERSELTPEDEDPFRSPRIVRKLALAARSTASFPGAFEPSFIPVGADGDDEHHPDLKGHTNFRSGRFVLDGGILMNQPIRPALEAIATQPAARQVRRVLAYVNPDPRPGVDRVARGVEEPPLGKVLFESLVTLPAAQTVQAELEDIQRMNREARDRRLARIDLVKVLKDEVDPMAERLFDTYRTVRKRRAVTWIADVVTKRLSTSGKAAPKPEGSETPTPAWTREELVDALERGTFDSIPTSFPPKRGRGALEIRNWGLSPMDRIGGVATDLFRRAMWAVPASDVPLRAELRGVRAALSRHVVSLKAWRDDDRRFWEAEVDVDGGLPQPPPKSSDRPTVLQTWASAALARWPVPLKRRLGTEDTGPEDLLEGLERVTLGIVQLIVDSGTVLRKAVDLGLASGVPDLVLEAGNLRDILDVLLGKGRASTSIAACLRRLLALEVCQLALTGAPPPAEQEVELIQISGNAETSFAGSLTASKKLAGVKLGHFGAFYKESWRVSDWIWGRLDGATRLCRAILSPQRLRQLNASADGALAAVRRVAVDAASPSDREWLEGEFPSEETQRNELAFLKDNTMPVPPSMPGLAMAVARRAHVEILREELPRLYRAVRRDIRAGAADGTIGRSFADEYETLHQGPGLTTAAMVDLFRRWRIAEEALGDEAGSDLLASTVSTTAAVGISAVQTTASKLGPVKWIARALRGVTLAVYALVTGAVRGSSFGVGAVSFALAVGGASLAIALLVPDAPPLAGALGATLLLGGLALAALRSGLGAYALITAVLAVVLIGGSVWLSRDLEDIVDQLQSILIVVLVVALAILLGSVGTRRSKGRREAEEDLERPGPDCCVLREDGATARHVHPAR